MTGIEKLLSKPGVGKKADVIGDNKMTGIEKLLSKPGVGKKVVRKIIGTQPGSSASVAVKDGSQTRFIKATVLRRVGAKLVK